MNPFNWIRTKVAQAVVLGFNDGCAAIAEGEDDKPANVEELRALVARQEPKALPASSEEEEAEAPAKGRRR